MIFIKILLAIAATFAVFHAIKSGISRNRFLSSIAFGLAVGVVLALFPSKTTLFTGIGIYFVFVLLTFVYGIIAKDVPLKSRLVICLMTAPIIAYWIWILNHWHGNTLLLPGIVLFAGFAGIVMKAKLKKELGILILLSTDAIAIFFEYWLKMP